MEELKTIKKSKIISAVISLVIFFIPIFISIARPSLKIIENESSMETIYYDSLNETSCYISLKFNRDVKDGYATIKFFDASHKLLSTNDVSFYSYNKTANSKMPYSINGNVKYFEIVSYSFKADNVISNLLLFGITYTTLLTPAIIVFLFSFRLSYKEYDVNGRKVSVYAGWFNHTLKCDGKIYDEHITELALTPIHLSTTLEDGTNIDVSISLSNIIAVKVNNRLIQPNK